MIKKIVLFLKNDVWQASLENKNHGIKFLIKQLRNLMFAIRGFSKDDVQLRASALTLYSLLSIVPVLAMVFGIAKGFGFDQFLQDYLNENLSQHQAILNEAINFANKMLARIKGGVIAGVGLVVLIWSVMNIMGNIEGSFNHIWKIKKPRDFSRKISDYISLVVIAPILVLVSSSLKMSMVNDFFKSTLFISYLGPLIKIGFWLLSFSIIWVVFTLLYIVLPNTKVKFRSAVYGGIIAGTTFHILQWLYFSFQGLLSGYGAIYGSFAALPLFLIWLQYSWLIVLWGAELSFANQNVENYAFKKDIAHISKYNLRLLALLICREIVKTFANAIPAKTAAEIAENIKVPVRLVRDIIGELQSAGILSETASSTGVELAYQPAIDISHISACFVIDKLDKQGHDRLHPIETKEYETLSDIMKTFYDDLNKSPKNKLLKDI
jgi:membrane protein